MPARTASEAGALAANRSLERGLRILRVFRPGSTVLGNSDIAESTGLPRSTVSRLTQTLVACGFLQHDARAKAYRLGPPVLSLSEALLSGSEFLGAARPFMRELGESHQVNVSVSVADQCDMVYLESVRIPSAGFARRSSAGRRTPMEMTAFGRAHLAALPHAERRRLMTIFRKRHLDNWQRIRAEIDTAIVNVGRQGYCLAMWLEGVAAIATPIETHDRQRYVLGLSATSETFNARLQKELVPHFLRTAEQLRHCASRQR